MVTVLILFISVGRGKILAFTLVYLFLLSYLVYVVVLYSTAFGCCDKISVYYCNLHSSLRRAVSKRTFYVSKRTFAVSKRTVLPRDMSCLGDEIDMFSCLKRNVWLLYTMFTI